MRNTNLGGVACGRCCHLQVNILNTISEEIVTTGCKIGRFYLVEVRDIF